MAETETEQNDEVRPVYDLDELIDQITPDNLPEYVDFGPPVGNEFW